jgi:carbamoyltransferase
MIAILGISAFYHDSAASLIIDGVIVAAAQEERFTRLKHDDGFPHHAIACVLEQAGLSLERVDYAVFYEKPFIKFERLIETYLAFAPRGFLSFAKAMPLWVREKLFQKEFLIKELKKFDPAFDEKRLLFSEHHLSHAASAFYPSPFEDAVVLTLDGTGEWATTTVSIGKGADLQIIKELHFPHSPGLLYSAFTYYAGFKVNSGEYKLMGLAPYGTPRFKDVILEHLIDLKDDGSFRLNMKYFDFATGLRMINRRFERLFGPPTRRPDVDPLTTFHMDIAASIQAVTEQVVLNMTRALADEFNMDNLCLAGGVALNCVANGKILRDGTFKNIWVQPAAGDAGGSLGAALAAWHAHLKQPRRVNPDDQMSGSYLGPSYAHDEIEKQLQDCGAVFQVCETIGMIERTSQALADGFVIGWFQGRMEFGPRALGARSILADPRRSDMQKNLNLKVKFRESFRPFAPSVLEEDASRYFDLSCKSPYMLFVADVLPSLRLKMTEAQKALFGIDKLNVLRSSLPAVTHVDYSARVQTVCAQTHPLYHALIASFKQKTGCAALINTSFNVRGEPIVCTPSDAFRCFMGTGIDMLSIGNCVLYKKDQDLKLAASSLGTFDHD